MSVLPLHTTIQGSESGIFLKEFSPDSPGHPLEYVHRDNYYLFGFVMEGHVRVAIDFREYELRQGDMICIQPYQVHRIISSGKLVVGALLFIEDVCVDVCYKKILTDHALQPYTWSPDDVSWIQLKQLLSMIASRKSEMTNEASFRILRSLADAVLGMVVASLKKTISSDQLPDRRSVEIMLSFKSLIATNIQVRRSPAFYADKLCISCVYLNEVVNEVAGLSASKYIQAELIQLAKRYLAFTKLSIQEIALELGFEDPAYFSRLFTRNMGMTPSRYRQKSHE